MSETPQENSKMNLLELVKAVTPIITTLLTLFIGFQLGSVTALNKYRSDTQLQNQSYMLEARQTAYSNFFAGQANLRESERLNAIGSTVEAAQLRTEYNLAVKTSLFQIVMFGSKKVNDALAEHFRTSLSYAPCAGDIQRWQNEAQIYRNMRQEVFGNDDSEQIDDNTILILLFACTLP